MTTLQQKRIPVSPMVAAREIGTYHTFAVTPNIHYILVLTTKDPLYCSAGYGRVCLFAAQRAANYTCKEIVEMKEGSKLFGDDNTFPWMRRQDLTVGDKLGEGGFSNVSACSISLQAEEDRQQPHQQYAIKFLKRKAMADPSHFRHGAADLAMEAQYVL